LKKTRENQTYIEFKKIPIGNLGSKQVDLKQFEISESKSKEYKSMRNKIIYKLHKKNLKYSEIENLQVQDIDNSFSLIRIERGNRIFRIAISKELSDDLRVLTKYKDDKDYIFTKDLINNEKLSGTMINKIVKKLKEIENYDIEAKNEKSLKNKEIHTVERICDKYVIYKNGRVVEGLVINNITNALRVCDILNADETFK
jgi:archaellin